MKKIFITFLVVLLIPISAYSNIIGDYFYFVQSKNLSGIKQLLYNPTPERLKVYRLVFAAVDQRINSVKIKRTQVFRDKAIVEVHSNVTIYDKFNKRSFNEDNDLVFLLQKQSNRWKIAKVMPLADFILKKKLLIIKKAMDQIGNNNKVIYNTAEGGENFLNNNQNNNSFRPKNNYTYLGCFKDQGDPYGLRGRDLAAFGFGSDRMTPTLCMRECARRGYRYAGVQYSSQCFCGNSYGKYGRATNCNMKCTGDKNQTCGGSWANNIYNVTGLNVPRIHYNIGVEVNTDRPGLDYKSFNLPYPDYKLCQNACDKDPKCRAWTYVKPYTIQGAYAKCWLKNAIPNPVRKRSCISGIKRTIPKTMKTFRYPKINGYRLDWCRLWAQDCGEGAADTFCKRMGFKRAINFQEDYDIGARSPTYVIDSGKICNQSFCDGFKYITCAGKNDGTVVATTETAHLQNKTTTSTKCKVAYRRFVRAYNKVVGLMSRGKGNTAEAKRAYAEYKTARENYYSCKNRKASGVSTGYNTAINSEHFMGHREKPILSFRDDFYRFNPTYWEAYEWKTLKPAQNKLSFHNGYLDLKCNYTDRSAFIVSKPIPIKKGEILIIRRRLKVHYANKYFEGGIWFYQTDGRKIAMPQNRNAWLSAFGKNLFNVTYFNYYYEKPGVRQYVPTKFGFVIYGIDWRNKRNYSIFTPIWDKWFTEEIIYNPAKNEATYRLNGYAATVKTAPLIEPYIRFIMHPYGWYTGHDIKIDWVDVIIKKANAVSNNNPSYSIDKCAVYQNKQDYLSMRFPKYLDSNNHDINLTCSVYMLPKGSRIKAEWYYIMPNKEFFIAQKTVTVERSSKNDKYVNFRIENYRSWPQGSYRVTIKLNDRIVDTIYFKVR